jgi:hypothetical protein
VLRAATFRSHLLSVIRCQVSLLSLVLFGPRRPRPWTRRGLANSTRRSSARMTRRSRSISPIGATVTLLIDNHQPASSMQVRSYGQGTRRMVTLACNLDFFGSRIFARWTAVTFTRLHRAPAWQVRTLGLFNRRHFAITPSHVSVTRIAVGSRRICTSGSLPQLHEPFAIAIVEELGNDPVMRCQYRTFRAGRLVRIDRFRNQSFQRQEPFSNVWMLAKRISALDGTKRVAGCTRPASGVGYVVWSRNQMRCPLIINDLLASFCKIHFFRGIGFRYYLL